MLRLTARQWMTPLILSAILLSIPTWTYATSFTVSSAILGGGTFTGAFTVNPDPVDILNFTFSTATTPTFSFAVTGIMGIPPVSFTQTNATISGMGIVTAGVLTNLTVQPTPAAGIPAINVFGPELQFGVGSSNNGGFPFTNTLLVEQTGTADPIPEPGTFMLLTTGLLSLAGYRWLQRRREGTQVA